MKKTIYVITFIAILVILGLLYLQLSKTTNEETSVPFLETQDVQSSRSDDSQVESQEEAGGGNQLVLEGDPDTSAIDTDISTWTTYTNDSCNFSIKFPSSFVVLSDMDTCTEGADYNAQTHNVVRVANKNGCLVTQLGQQPAEGCEIHEVYLLNSTPSASGPSITNSTKVVAGIPSQRITSI